MQKDNTESKQQRQPSHRPVGLSLWHVFQHKMNLTKGYSRCYIVSDPDNSKQYMVACGLACDVCGHVNSHRIRKLNGYDERYLKSTTPNGISCWISKQQKERNVEDL